jgi:inorganic triphosphatase YgiF
MTGFVSCSKGRPRLTPKHLVWRFAHRLPLWEMNGDSPPATSPEQAPLRAGDIDSGTEAELKLLLEPAYVAQFRRHPTLRALATGRPSARPLVSTYYDSEGQDLLRAGLSLRVRRVRGGFVQTLKSQGTRTAGLFERIEVECPLPDERPDPLLTPDAGLRRRVEEALRGQPLRPVLETDVRRSEWRLRDGETELRVDLDQGEIRTPRGTLPICELELELLRGDARVLYDLALELLDTIPLRVATRSKLERGHALLTGGQTTPQQMLELAPDASVEDAFEAIVGICVGQILANEACAVTGADSEGVHQMRVGVRRVRSALSLFRSLLPADMVEPLRVDLRWLSGELGPARDLDVFVEETLNPLARQFPVETELKRLRDEAQELRVEGYARARAAIASKRYATLILHLGRFLAARSWRQQALSPESAQLFQPASEHARDLLRRRARKVRRLGSGIRERTIPELHELRIQLKKLRYAAESLHRLFPQRKARRTVRRIVALQDSLGHLNDVITAEDILTRILERLGEEGTPGHLRAAGFVLGWVARGAERELEGLPRLWKRFADMKPYWSGS